MDVEYDSAKRAMTLKYRGLDMARAGQIFAGGSVTVLDDRRDYGEPRYITVGFLEESMVVMVWTRRGRTRRIISLRKANGREKRKYQDRI